MKPFLKAGMGMLVLLSINLQISCTSSSYIHKANDSNAWKNTRAELEKIQSWNIRGKISIRAEADLYTADLYWQQQQQNLNMRLVAPFSQGVTQFSGSDQAGYIVLTERGERFDVDAPESVTDNAFGVALPFTELKSWVRGLPDRQTAVWNAHFDAENRLSQFQQSGWQVKLLKYKKIDTQQLPTKLFLKRLTDDVDEKKVDVRLIVRHWSI